ncbi:Olfactory receptor 4A15 [Heterocephalus glaber]|uniref:Olfactory receptor 4A15 n=1 Tax=Heterocephalus glaber TaxID=10181 RepID=G5BIX1_HETGA|nr:Olfactory receptor 4A15 [Heterocephalus glaber]
MLGNLLIMVTVLAGPSLGSPMYFFIADLLLLDGVFSTVFSPNLLIDLLSDRKTISFPICMGQIFTEHLFAGAEVLHLVAIAYDHYMAILVSWAGGFAQSVIQVVFVYNLPFCGPSVIDHFVCDMYPLLELPCTDTYLIVFTVVANGVAICTTVFILLFVSYKITLNSLKTLRKGDRQVCPCPTKIPSYTEYAESDHCMQ